MKEFTKEDVERMVAAKLKELRIDIARYDAGKIGERPVRGIKVKLMLGRELITDSVMTIPWEGLQ